MDVQIIIEGNISFIANYTGIFDLMSDLNSESNFIRINKNIFIMKNKIVSCNLGDYNAC